MISAVCIVSIPGDEVRKISDFPVFVCTALFSLWAYLWMLLVYVIWTPNQITLLEAGLTLTYLPIMVGMAYLIDARPWNKKESDNGEDCGQEAGYANSCVNTSKRTGESCIWPLCAHLLCQDVLWNADTNVLWVLGLKWMMECMCTSTSMKSMQLPHRCGCKPKMRSVL